MAEQPSITSILAALAAQRPTSAVNQQQQYAPPQAPPQNSYAPAGYSLPQPTNTGSVDLSNIKPVNSGTVNFADAVAKAKAIAAAKGLQYDRPASYGGIDPRQALGRPQRRSRSRSRSPNGRRDAFRDNYNPYRDERRAERPPQGRDPYGRERSFSPVGRGRGVTGTFSPPRPGLGGSSYPARDRSPVNRTGDNDNAESISIESNLVGLIIGRNGENLRRVESETGCRVQFVTGPEEGALWRQCKITGPRVRRNEAKAEINRIIDESGMGGSIRPGNDRNSKDAAGRASSHQPALRDGEDSMQIMVPDRTVGLIIGRGGETIRDLQERSGCHVNIVGESKSINGLRPVNLIGSREAAAKAKEMILEIVESDSKTGGAKAQAAAPTQRDLGRDSGLGGGGDKMSDSIFVPSEAVGMIIGKGGETIKDMQNTTGCKINVSPSSGPGEVEREIGLIGPRDAIDAAKRAIEDKVEAVQIKNGAPPRRAQQNDYNDRGFQQSQNANATPLPTAQVQPTATGGEDPYAAYGGYQNYVALWYQAIAQQQQAGQAQGDATKPPGTA